MKPSDALESKRMAVREAALRHRASNPRVFGSVARGADTAGSDIDILVDTRPDATLLDLGGLQVELEEILGLRVDLLTPGDLPTAFQKVVLEQAIPI